MSKTEKLNKKIKEIEQILIEIEFLKIDIISISDNKQTYFESVVKNSQFLYRTYRNSIKLVIIDLNKLILKREDSNFQSMLDYSLINFKTIEWKHQFNIEEIKTLKREINQLAESKEIEIVQNLRDKFYAHSDKNKDKFEQSLKLVKLWDIISILKKIFDFVNFKLNNRKNPYNQIKPPIELYTLDKYSKIKELMFRELRKGSDLGELQRIRNIMFDKPA
jgi:hypothetical protein